MEDSTINKQDHLSHGKEPHGASLPGNNTVTQNILATPAVIQKLKKIVDQRLRSNPQEALRLGEAAHLLAQQLPDPLMQALGLRAHAVALHVSGQHSEH